MIQVPRAAFLPFVERRPGCGKHVIEEGAAFQLSVCRLEPGARVPRHAHTSSHDIFVGIEGEVRIEAEGDAQAFPMGPGGVCSVAPGAAHEVVNAHATQAALFVLVHAPFDRFDVVPPHGAPA